MITKSVWPEYLLDHVWRLLDPLHGLAATTIEKAVKAVQRDLTATIQAQPTAGGDGSEPLGYEVTWNEEDPKYMPASEAITTYTAGKLLLSTLSKKLGTLPIHFMRRGRRARVNIHDFAAWAKKTYPSDAECAEIADEYLADIEARKAAEHNNRAQN